LIRIRVKKKKEIHCFNIMEVKSKFNIGDVVFHISDNKIKEQKVSGVGMSVSERGVLITYTLSPGDEKVSETNLFRTKEEVLNTL